MKDKSSNTTVTFKIIILIAIISLGVYSVNEISYSIQVNGYNECVGMQNLYYVGQGSALEGYGNTNDSSKTILQFDVKPYGRVSEVEECMLPKKLQEEN